MTESSKQFATLDVSPHGELIKKLLAYIPVEGQAGIAVRDALMKEAANAIAALHERLEDSYYFDWEGNRVECAPGSIPDGISCRDETIKLQDQAIDKFRSARSETAPSAWSPISKSGLLRGIRHGKPSDEDLAIAKADGDTIRYFYDSPSETIPSAIRESADTARMDWLETQDMIGIHHEGYGDYTYYAGGAFEPLREAVDAAMKKEAK